MTTIYTYQCDVCKTKYENENDVSDDFSISLPFEGSKYFYLDHICERCVLKLQDILNDFFTEYEKF